MKPLLNSDEICEYMGISYNRFLQYTREDESFPARKMGGEWRADRDELKAWFINQPKSKSNIIDISAKRKRGRPPIKSRTISQPAGGWTIKIP